MMEISGVIRVKANKGIFPSRAVQATLTQQSTILRKYHGTPVTYSVTFMQAT